MIPGIKKFGQYYLKLKMVQEDSLIVGIRRELVNLDRDLKKKFQTLVISGTICGSI